MWWHGTPLCTSPPSACRQLDRHTFLALLILTMSFASLHEMLDGMELRLYSLLLLEAGTTASNLLLSRDPAIPRAKSPSWVLFHSVLPCGWMQMLSVTRSSRTLSWRVSCSHRCRRRSSGARSLALQALRRPSPLQGHSKGIADARSDTDRSCDAGRHSTRPPGSSRHSDCVQLQRGASCGCTQARRSWTPVPAGWWLRSG